MRQNEVKRLMVKYPDRLFLLQNGDRYYAKGEDAEKVQQAAGGRPLRNYKHSVHFAACYLNEIVHNLLRMGCKITIVEPIK